MARIDGVDPGRTEGRIRAVLEAQAKKWGGPLLNHLVYARHPDHLQGRKGDVGGLDASGLVEPSPRCAHQPQGRRPERLRVLTGYKRCRGQRAGDPRSKSSLPSESTRRALFTGSEERAALEYADAITLSDRDLEDDLFAKVHGSSATRRSSNSRRSSRGRTPPASSTARCGCPRRSCGNGGNDLGAKRPGCSEL